MHLFVVDCYLYITYGWYATNVNVLAAESGTKYHFAYVFCNSIWPLPWLCSAHQQVKGNFCY